MEMDEIQKHTMNNDCLSCGHSFSEPAQDENEFDLLHCTIQDEKVVDEENYCDEWNKVGCM